mgnify:CR=1 FL=1
MTDKYLVCLDPDSFQFFSIGLYSRTLVLELDVPLKMREKAVQTLKDMRKLLDSGGTNWWFKSKQSWAFRRRILPKYLINKDTSPYPRFLQLTELSSAFSEATTIEIAIDLTRYSHLKSEGAIKVNLPQNYQISVPLATG